MKVAVFGLGYVGTVTSACLAELGNDVVGVDINSEKVRLMNEMVDFIGERGLEVLLKKNVGKNLRATSDLSEAVSQSDVGLICVGTPPNPEGFTDISRVELVFEGILKAAKKPYVAAVRSTITPGTLDLLGNRMNEEEVSLVANPEFLREGSAVEDFLHPGMIVIGSKSEEAKDKIESLYASISSQVIRTDTRTAEMIKYLNNTWHALKIGFTNEVSSVASSLGIDPYELFEVFCADTKLNVSRKYHRPGFSYGGSCLTKDHSALVGMARKSGIETPIIDSVETSNNKHLDRAVRKIMAIGEKDIGVFGISFRDDGSSPDIRGSSTITLIHRLVESGFYRLFGQGFNISVYDPTINLDELGSYLPDLKQKVHPDMAEVVNRSRVLVLGNSSREYKRLPEMMQDSHTLVDLQGVFRPADIKRGKYVGMYSQ